MWVLTKVYLDAIDNEDFAVLQAWAKPTAAVRVPDDWFKDHFAHEPIWIFPGEDCLLFAFRFRFGNTFVEPEEVVANSGKD